MRKETLFAAAALLLTACASKEKDTKYQLNGSGIDGLADGEMVYVTNYDTAEKVDSAMVTDGAFSITGVVDAPFMARLVQGDNRLPSFIIEAGEITISDEGATGTKLNEELAKISDRLNAIGQEAYMLGDPAQQDSLIEVYTAYSDSVMNANMDNPIGLAFFLEKIYDMNSEELAAAMEKYPNVKASKRVQKMAEAFDRQEATAEGKMFTDFEVEYDGNTYRLSDYVGKGKWTLVDFWASWCGPCRREAATIKDLYNEYGPKGLDVVGIAVWDEPEATLAAIEELELPWTQVINAQNVPTDLYGIFGIPHIILFDPEGKIVSRGLQGDELRESVSNAFAEGLSQN